MNEANKQSEQEVDRKIQQQSTKRKKNDEHKKNHTNATNAISV